VEDGFRTMKPTPRCSTSSISIPKAINGFDVKSAQRHSHSLGTWNYYQLVIEHSLLVRSRSFIHSSIGLNWIGLDWIGLDWIGLDWVELDWIGLDWIGLDWIGLDWIGLDWIGLDWIGLDCNDRSIQQMGDRSIRTLSSTSLHSRADGLRCNGDQSHS